jgi:signal transduction histidine kinase
VLQEMLTNALRHGVRGRPVSVERHWEGELRIEVRNGVDPGSAAAPVGGLGIDGMRRRLESVGGRLDVCRRDDTDGSSFSATAWIPLRTVNA